MSLLLFLLSVARGAGGCDVPIEPDATVRTVADAFRAFVEIEEELFKHLSEKISDQVGCWDRPASPTEVARVLSFYGLVAAQSGDEVSAMEYFGAAADADPGVAPPLELLQPGEWIGELWSAGRAAFHPEPSGSPLPAPVSCGLTGGPPMW